MSAPNSGNCDRHCAYCLKLLPVGTAKRCGKCHRRAYCSRDCQKIDWKQKPGSQGHKNWCDLRCGEEDIDWEVKPVPGKGLGIIAKRFIPAKFRIIVEPPRHSDHPGFKDLIGGTLQEKLLLNQYGRDYDEGPVADGTLCLRTSRLNHDCDPNSSHQFDPTYDVRILFSERDIQPGEEITITYYPLTGCKFGDPKMPAEVRKILKDMDGIVCKDDCICRNPEFVKLLCETNKMDREVLPTAISGDCIGAMEMVEKLLKNHEAMRSCQMSWSRTFEQGFKIGISRHETRIQALEYMARACEINAAIFHPNSNEVLQLKNYVMEVAKKILA